MESGLEKVEFLGCQFRGKKNGGRAIGVTGKANERKMVFAKTLSGEARGWLRGISKKESICTVEGESVSGADSVKGNP